MDRYLLFMALLIWPEISFTLEAVDDFEVPVEITFHKRTLDPVQRKSKKIVLTEGRTRAFRNTNRKLDNTEQYKSENSNYCCFWVYQTHPAVPQIWKHMSEYPFDFNLNGVFLMNKRNNQSGE